MFRKIAMMILELSSWISMIVGFLLVLPIGLLFMVVFPFQVVMIWWEDGMGWVNHSCDWWMIPLDKVTEGHGLVIFLGLILNLVLFLFFMWYHAWVCEKFKLKSPLEERWT